MDTMELDDPTAQLGNVSCAVADCGDQTKIVWGTISREYLGILILSVLPAASYIHTKTLYRKILLPSSHPITISFLHTTPTTFRHISSPDPLTQFHLHTEFSLSEHS